MSSQPQSPPGAQVLPIAPTLTSPAATSTGSSTASLGVTTDQASGVLYWLLSTSNTPPSIAQVMAGEDSTGSAAAASGSQSVTGAGAQAASATGLANGTTYYAFFMQANARFLSSGVVGTTSFTAGGGGGGGSFGTLDFSSAANSDLLLAA